MNLIDFGLAGPALTAHLAGRGLAALGNRFCQRLGQIEISADAFLVGAINAEDGFGVLGMKGELDLFAPGEASGLKMGELRGQRFQFLKLFGEADRLFHSFVLLPAVIGPRVGFLRSHSVVALSPSL